MPGVFPVRAAVILCAASCAAAAGCAGLGAYVPGGNAPPVVANPLLVPTGDTEFLWNQITDEIDDYFRIEREDRVRQIGGVFTEGRLETFPTVGSTVLEPWRRDATPGFEKLQGTLQSIRRSAVVRVIPSQGGFLVDVAVFKELEDVPVPQSATAGSVVIRTDTSPNREVEFDPVLFGRISLGWIPIGRDASLEQRILINLAGRLNVQPSAASSDPFLAGASAR